MNCLTGFFQGPFPEESMAETLLRAPDGGAVAVWGSSGMTDASTQALMNRELFRQMFGGAATFGDAILASKRAVTDPDVRRTWIFFGYPAMRLIGAPSPGVLGEAPAGHAQADPRSRRRRVRQRSSTSARRVSPPAVRLVDVDGDRRVDLWLDTARATEPG